MRDGVDEAVVLLVAPDLQDEKHRVDDEAGDDQAEQDHAEDDWDNAAGIGDDPADIERNGGCNEQHAQRDEECDRLLPPCHRANRLYAERGEEQTEPLTS